MLSNILGRRRMIIKLGTRKSKLALIQAQIVANKINLFYPKAQLEIIPIVTSGDLILNKNLYEVGGKALFLKEIEKELIDGHIDMAVHSLKDMPGKLPDELEISAVLERDDPRDVLISYKSRSIEELPETARVGTSSPRRKILLQKYKPRLNIVTFRGNVDSRISKFQQGEVDATILAASGLKRLGLFNDQYCYTLDPQYIIPAAGQGVIAIETRRDNTKMLQLAHLLNHQPTWILAQAERAFIQYLDASCHTPIAAHAIYNSQDNIQARYMLADIHGDHVIFHQESGSKNDSASIGAKAAQHILKRMETS